MLTSEDVVRIAHQHIEGLRPVEGIVWCLSEGKRVDGGWYIDYEAKRLPSNPPSPGSGFGYAPGFLVADDGTPPDPAALIHVTDRVEALGGRLVVEQGTLRAEIPCE